jgi:hypothetical protein
MNNVMKNRCSDKWEEQFIDFEAHGGMPALGARLYNWKKSQLSYGQMI